MAASVGGWGRRTDQVRGDGSEESLQQSSEVAYVAAQSVKPLKVAVTRNRLSSKSFRRPIGRLFSSSK